ncbi:MAG: molybdopterin converting factor subunit 1 [Alphaproteobacteria bacterium]|nr:molybdopterin converting factor subunit 1 [Alphaproteobacteria bacterium]MCB9929605.1 molybdopterin converting factor subunit 1 [Alphaproteobacteria bacterium]
MNVLYFAWVRAKIGTGREAVDPPASVVTVADLARWLSQQSPGHAEAFADLACVRAAINQEFVDPATPIPAGAEIAFFPPVTGG